MRKLKRSHEIMKSRLFWYPVGQQTKSTPAEPGEIVAHEKRK